LGQLTATAEMLIARAEADDVALRMVGSLAYRVHCGRHADKLDQLGREIPQDLDLVAPSRTFRQLEKVFGDCGFVMDEQVAMASDRTQLYFQERASGLGVDVYLGRLTYCHEIDFDGRLEQDSPTAPLAELWLTKLQIVELTGKDVSDMLVLLLEHELTDGEEPDTIDIERICGVLGADWGFYYTVENNLAKLEQSLVEISALDEGEKAIVAGRLERFRKGIEDTPKTRKWKMRQRVGPRVKWYQPVEEKHQPGF
jgi:hypothetical protein